MPFSKDERKKQKAMEFGGKDVKVCWRDVW